MSQQTPGPADNDTTTTIEILGARKLEFKKINDSTQLQILAGNVKLKQGTTLFYSDSCIINNSNHIFEAWGHVHIVDSDTADAYSNHLLYMIQKKVAYLDGAVKLTDGKGMLVTPDVEYNLETKIGIYKHGGKVTTEKTVLTSKEGYYYTDLKDVYFKNNVELKDPAYFIKTDSLLYNTEFQTARFIAETFIKDSSGRTIETKEGVYNMQTGRAEFGRRPIVHDKNLFATGNDMMSDDSAGIVQFRGNAIIIDSVNQTTIIAGEIFINKKNNSFLAFKKPLMILKQENDSLYITADTLFSGRITDLLKRKKPAEKDTAKVVDSVVVNTKKSLNNNDSIANNSINEKKLLTINENDSTNFQVDSVSSDITKTTIPVDINETDSSIQNKNISIKDDTVKEKKILPINEKDSISPKKENSVAKNILKKTNPAPAPEKEALNRNNKASDTLYIVKDINPLPLNENDSTNRYFEAYRNVRIFSDSLQAICDSMFYSFQDSIFRLFYDPVVWSKESQITGDTVLLFTKNKKADHMKVINNSLFVSQLSTETFNQVKSSRMDAFFKNGVIDSVRASGLAECIYYIMDEDSAYTGVNESKSDVLDAYFVNQGLQKVIFRSSVTGTLWPIRQKDPKEMRLSNFKWLEGRRPKSKFDLY